MGGGDGKGVRGGAGEEWGGMLVAIVVRVVIGVPYMSGCVGRSPRNAMMGSNSIFLNFSLYLGVLSYYNFLIVGVIFFILGLNPWLRQSVHMNVCYD